LLGSGLRGGNGGGLLLLFLDDGALEAALVVLLEHLAGLGRVADVFKAIGGVSTYTLKQY